MITEIRGRTRFFGYPEFYYRKMVESLSKYVDFTVESFEYDGKHIRIVLAVHRPKAKTKKAIRIYDILSNIDKIEFSFLENIISKLNLWEGKIIVMTHYFRKEWVYGKGLRNMWKIKYRNSVSGCIILVWKARAMITHVSDIYYPEGSVNLAVSFPLNYWKFEELVQLLEPVSSMLNISEEVIEKIDDIKKHNEFLAKVIEACYVLSGF